MSYLFSTCQGRRKPGNYVYEDEQGAPEAGVNGMSRVDEAKLQKYEDEIDALSRELRQVKRKNLRLLEEMNKKDDRVLELEQSVRDRDEIISQLQDDIGILRGELELPPQQRDVVAELREAEQKHAAEKLARENADRKRAGELAAPESAVESAENPPAPSAPSAAPLIDIGDGNVVPESAGEGH